MKDTHLGDGVYASYNGCSIWLDLRTQPRMSRTALGHEGICLEPEVLRALDEFREQCGLGPQRKKKSERRAT